MAVTRPLAIAEDDVGQTSPAASTDRFLHLLRDRGFNPLHIPTTRILPPEDPGPIRRAAERIVMYDWVVVTSARAVEPLVDALEEAGAGTHEMRRVCAVGPRTAEALVAAGIEVDLVPDRFVAEGVVEALLEAARDARAGSGKPLEDVRILIPRAEEGREVIPTRLEAAGAQVEVVPVYRTVPDPEGAGRLARLVAEGDVDVLTFAAGSAARSFAAAWREVWREVWREGPGSGGPPPRVRIAAIGPATASVLEKEGLRADAVADPHTLEGLADAVRALTGNIPR